MNVIEQEMAALAGMRGVTQASLADGVHLPAFVVFRFFPLFES